MAAGVFFEKALRVAEARRATWFDPQLVDIVVGWRKDDDWWDMLRSPELQSWVIEFEPPGRSSRA